MHSLKHQIKEWYAAMFSVQETQFKKRGKFQYDDFIIFEAIRKNNEKGGTMVGIHKYFEPVLVEEYEENFELLVIE